MASRLFCNSNLVLLRLRLGSGRFVIGYIIKNSHKNKKKTTRNEAFVSRGLQQPRSAYDVSTASYFRSFGSSDGPLQPIAVQKSEQRRACSRVGKEGAAPPGLLLWERRARAGVFAYRWEAGLLLPADSAMSIQEDPVQREIHQDWANREYIELITSSIKKIADFLNSFGRCGRRPLSPGREGRRRRRRRRTLSADGGDGRAGGGSVAGI